MNDPLPTAVAVRITSLGGIITRDDLDDLEVPSAEVSRWVNQSLVRRTRRRAFVDARTWEVADQHERLRLETRSVARSLTHRHDRRPTSVAAANTAAMVWDLPVLGRGPRTFHLARTGEGPAERVGSVRTQTCWGPDSATAFAGVPVLQMAPTLLSIAATHGLDSGVVAMDAALHAGRVGVGDLQEWLLHCDGRRGIRTARDAMAKADASSESPGESLTRLALLGFGLDWRAQEWIETDDGRFRVDFLVGERVVVEFDGSVKYEGLDGRAALVAEKRREDALRRAGYIVVRLTWADLHDPARMAVLLAPAIDRRTAS